MPKSFLVLLSAATDRYRPTQQGHAPLREWSRALADTCRRPIGSGAILKAERRPQVIHAATWRSHSGHQLIQSDKVAPATASDIYLCHAWLLVLDRPTDEAHTHGQRKSSDDSWDGTSHGVDDRPLAGRPAQQARRQQGQGGRRRRQGVRRGRGRRGAGGPPRRARAGGHRRRRRRLVAGGARRDRQFHQDRSPAAALRWTPWVPLPARARLHTAFLFFFLRAKLSSFFDMLPIHQSLFYIHLSNLWLRVQNRLELICKALVSNFSLKTFIFPPLPRLINKHQ